MDTLTHTLLGAALGNALLRPALGPGGPIVMAVASNLPDVDALVHLSGSSEAILLRRTFGHSIFTIPLLAAGFAWACRRRRPDVPFETFWKVGLLGSAIHLFFDWINSFGIVPLWPLSSWHPELGAVFIVDVFLAAIFAAPLLLDRLPPLRGRGPRLARASLAAAAGYLLLCASARVRAVGRLAEECARLGLRADFQYVFPEPWGPQRWRGVARAGEVYHLFLIQPFSGTIEARGIEPSDPGAPPVLAVRETALGRRLDWFFKAPVWTAHAVDSSAEVSVFDLRFRPLAAGFADRRPPFRFRFAVSSGGVRKL